jgi:hypothetical protein
MADIITRVVPSSPSLGHIASLTKEKGKHGRGAFTKDSPMKAKSPLLSAKSNAPRTDHGKGNVLDIRV